MPAFGDSMVPVVQSGDKIGIKKTTIDKILYGEIYAILTEDWRTIKYIRKAKDDDKLRLIPENKIDFDEQDILKRDVLEVFLVKVIAREKC